jgi:hypothetical protein
MASFCEARHTILCEDHTRKHCFSCGLLACGECSVRVPYRSYGMKRVCFPCLNEYAAYLNAAQFVERFLDVTLEDWQREILEGVLCG